jgi:predicted ATP-binding protein involved in virulence
MSTIVPLRSVTIENFRGIREMQLDLDPKVTLLFGANAAGKTSVLDAVAIGLGAIVARIPKATGRDFAKSGDLRVPWWEPKSDGFELTPVSPEPKGVERPYARIRLAAANELDWDVTKLRSKQDRKSAPLAIGTKALHELMDPLVIEALDTPPAAVGPSLPLVAAYGTERAVVEIPLRERYFLKEFHRLGALDQSLRATTRFKTVFEWFRVMEDEERRERERRGDFKYRLPELEWVRRAVDNAELHCRNPRVETKPVRMVVDFDHGDGALEPLDVLSLSDGYRTHFSLVVDLARRMVQLNPSSDLKDPERGTNTEAVVLIDEIDLHLDPTWQARVVRGLVAAFPRTQFVLTTHSEQVIASVEASSVRKLVWENGAIALEAVPFAQGASGERILIELMGANERVAGPVTEKLTAYMELVNRGKGEGTDAKMLRAQLDASLPGDERLHQADLEMQKRALLSQIKSGSR